MWLLCDYYEAGGGCQRIAVDTNDLDSSDIGPRWNHIAGATVPIQVEDVYSKCLGRRTALQLVENRIDKQRIGVDASRDSAVPAVRILPRHETDQ